MEYEKAIEIAKNIVLQSSGSRVHAVVLAEALLAMHEELEFLKDCDSEMGKVAKQASDLRIENAKLQSELEDAIDVRDAFIAKNEILEGELKEALEILRSASQNWLDKENYYYRISERAREFIAKRNKEKT